MAGQLVVREHAMEPAEYSARTPATSSAGGRGTLENALALLRSEDRMILELTLQRGVPLRLAGQAIGRTAGTTLRRRRRILQALNSPVSAAVLDPRCPVSQTQREALIDRHFRFARPREIRARFGLSPDEMLALTWFVRGWARGRGNRA